MKEIILYFIVVSLFAILIRLEDLNVQLKESNRLRQELIKITENPVIKKDTLYIDTLIYTEMSYEN